MENDTSDSAEMLTARVMRMQISALQQLHQSLFGKDCTVVHVLYLRRKLAWELQARSAGRLAEESRQHALGIAWQTTLRTRAPSHRPVPVSPTISFGYDTRLPPPGTLLRRDFKGKSVLVKVLSVRHKGETYPGEHERIVSDQVWTDVRERLSRAGRRGRHYISDPCGALLKGMIDCVSCGVAMTHTYAQKKGKPLYRCYVCGKAHREGWAACETPSSVGPGA